MQPYLKEKPKQQTNNQPKLNVTTSRVKMEITGRHHTQIWGQPLLLNAVAVTTFQKKKGIRHFAMTFTKGQGDRPKARKNLFRWHPEKEQVYCMKR